MDVDLFSTHKFIIQISNFTDPISLFPIGDIHYNNPSFHVQKFDECVSDMQRDKTALFLGMGDYIETFSDSERLGLQAAHLHASSSKTIENMVQRTLDEFIEKLSFLKGRIIGMIEGNHHYVFGSGITSTQYICEKLKCRYLGCSGFIRLTFQYDKGNRKSCVDIFAHHGKGAARLAGSSLNSVEAMSQAAVADVYIMGHDHKKGVAMSSRMELTDGYSGVNLREKRLIFIRSGSFLKGFEPNRGSYVAKKMLNPSDLGYVKVQFHPKLKSVQENGTRVTERFYIDTHASI